MPEVLSIIESVGKEWAKSHESDILAAYIGAQASPKGLKKVLKELRSTAGSADPAKKTGDDFIRDFGMGL